MPEGRQRYGAEGYRWNKFSQLVRATYGDLCYLCNHGGALHIDHIVPLTEDPTRVFDLSNCRPVHGVPGNRCPVCGLNCNGIKGGYSAERAQRIIAERIAKGQRRVKKPKTPKPAEDKGREW